MHCLKGGYWIVKLSLVELKSGIVFMIPYVIAAIAVLGAVIITFYAQQKK
jgi:hypothetical protein